MLGLGLVLSMSSTRADSPAPSFTIEQLVSFVLANSPALEAGRRSVELATAGVTTASALPNPRFELDGGRTSASTTTSAGNLTSVGVSQLIENPELRGARINSALYAECNEDSI